MSLGLYLVLTSLGKEVKEESYLILALKDKIAKLKLTASVHQLCKFPTDRAPRDMVQILTDNG